MWLDLLFYYVTGLSVYVGDVAYRGAFGALSGFRVGFRLAQFLG